MVAMVARHLHHRDSVSNCNSEGNQRVAMVARHLHHRDRQVWGVDFEFAACGNGGSTPSSSRLFARWQGVASDAGGNGGSTPSLSRRGQIQHKEVSNLWQWWLDTFIIETIIGHIGSHEHSWWQWWLDTFIIETEWNHRLAGSNGGSTPSSSRPPGLGRRLRVRGVWQWWLDTFIIETETRTGASW